MSYYICSKCHSIGSPARKKCGSGKVEFFLWMAFPFNIPYSLWRMLTKYNVCASCGNTALIPENSIVGQRLLAKMEEGAAPILAHAKAMERAESSPAVVLPVAEPTVPTKAEAVHQPSVIEDEKAFFAARAQQPAMAAFTPQTSTRLDADSF